MSETRIAAVVCTYNRADILSKCLTALTRQTMDAAAFQVIIVDNNSTDGTAEIIRSFCEGRPNWVPILETRQGLAIARNRGMMETDAPFVAFTDDDAEVGPDWLERLLRHFEALPDTTAAVGGEIVPVWETECPPWMDAHTLQLLSAHLGWSNTERFLQGDEWLCEVNSAYNKHTLLKYGGFPEALGRIGNNLLSGENAVNLLMAENGAQFYFDPSIIVRHHIPPSRLKKSWFRNRMFWQGVTGYLVDQFLDAKREELTGEGALPRPAKPLNLPCSSTAWTNTFSDDHSWEFDESLNTLWSLGYTLASQGVLIGR